MSKGLTEELNELDTELNKEIHTPYLVTEENVINDEKEGEDVVEKVKENENEKGNPSKEDLSKIDN